MNKQTSNTTNNELSDTINGSILKESDTNNENTFDNVFKSMKCNNKKLFIPVINEVFGKNYTKNDDITVLSSEGDFTKISYEFPNGQTIKYDCKNIIIKNYSKEEILNKQLYPYIPYYILRYEKEIKKEVKKRKIPLDVIEEEMIYLLKGLKEALKNGSIDEHEYVNIKSFTNTVIEHIVKGHEKERLVNIMGGKIIYTEADKIYYKAINEGMEKGLKAFVNTLKKYINNFDDLYAEVIKNEEYADVTIEQVKKYY